MPDYVSIRDLRVPAVIGALDWERDREQTLIVDVDLAADVSRAAASDELADAVDYAAVAAEITQLLRRGRFRLVETAAERTAVRLLAGYPVTWVRVRVRKPIAGESYTAAVTVERGTAPG